MHILCIIRLITECRFGFRDLDGKTRVGAVEYFEIVMNLFSLAYKTVTMKRFWCNQDQYLNILHTINENCNIPVSHQSLQVPPKGKVYLKISYINHSL